MLACANHACENRSKYLAKGKLFVFEQRTTGTRLQHRWLCKACARRWLVVWEHSRATLKPVGHALPNPRVQHIRSGQDDR